MITFYVMYVLSLQFYQQIMQLQSIQIQILYHHNSAYIAYSFSPIKPPGTANWRSFCSANNDITLDCMGWQRILPSVVLDTIPGRTSMSWPIYKIRKQFVAAYNLQILFNKYLYACTWLV